MKKALTRAALSAATSVGQHTQHAWTATATPIILLFTMALLAACHPSEPRQPRLMFDLAHGQFQDVFVDPSYYDYVVPDYRRMLDSMGIAYVPNHGPITAESLRDIDVLLMLSPLARSTQIPIGEEEKQAIADYIRGGGSVIMMIDEEEYRVKLDKYGANDITRQFGIVVGDDITDVPGNCGAVSIPGSIFDGRREIPYSGSRTVTGGTPASLCMEGSYVHGAYIETPAGGKLYVMGETMVGLLMGYDDGERNVHRNMQTRWWGKDSRLFMAELIAWAARK